MTLKEAIAVLFTNIPYVLLCVNILLVTCAVATLYLHLPRYAKKMGRSSAEISSLVSIIGIANFICRLLAGVITTTKCSSLLYYHLLNASLGCIITLAPWSGHLYSGQVIIAASAGMANSHWVLMSPFTIKFVGLRYLSYGYGFIVMLSGAGYFTGPVFAGEDDKPQ